VLTLGGRITGFRRDAGLSQRDLAKRTGIAQSTISAAERGAREPDLGTIRKLAAAMGVSAVDLLNEADR
jgi:transcriptional regulator with XRE-family HTH domain